MSAINLPWLDPNDFEARFPEAQSALKDPEGLVAAGGDLKPKRLLTAYREGIFPWYEEDQPILWWSPNPRGVLYPKQFVAHKRLLQTCKSKCWRVTYDQAFVEVMKACAEPRKNSRGTWITRDMLSAYTEMYYLGHAHSFEVWNEQNELIGGVYGTCIGTIFFGESMFSRVTDTSKIALLHLCAHLDVWGYKVMDTQLGSKHLASLGGIEIPREEYLSVLNQCTHERPSPLAWVQDMYVEPITWLQQR